MESEYYLTNRQLNLKVGDLIEVQMRNLSNEFLGEIVGFDKKSFFKIACLAPINTPYGCSIMNHLSDFSTILPLSKAYQHRLVWLLPIEIIKIVPGQW